jgi:diacylglycerol kinase (ATP)
MRVLLVFNPKAGDGLDVDRIVSLIESAGHAVEAQSIKEDDWAEALLQEHELVAIAGGDGTVRKLLIELAGTGRVTALLPVGTANNIATSLGLDEVDPALLVHGWEAGRLVRCDVGTVTIGTERKLFVEATGGGLFAELLVSADTDDRPEDEDKVDFGLRLLSHLVPEAPALEWRVLADGRDLSGEYLAVEAMNVREAGPKVPVAPTADPTDGMLDVTLIGPQHRAALVAYVEARRAERPAELPKFDITRAQQVELLAATDASFHVDDELAEHGTDGPVIAAIAEGVQILLPSSRRPARVPG